MCPELPVTNGGCVPDGQCPPHNLYEGEPDFGGLFYPL